MSTYTVVRLEYGISDATGAFHQSHVFSSHRSIAAAFRAADRISREYNCVAVVDENGKVVDEVSE